MQVAVIVPSYSQFLYVRRTIKSALANTPNSTVILVDDASPDWQSKDWMPAKWHHRLLTHRFKTQGGLTRSWNKGLEMAIQLQAKTIVCANSDLWFPRGWWTEMEAILLKYPKLCLGPTTNAPGHRRQQQIRKWLPEFQSNDDPTYLDQVSQTMQEKYRGQIEKGPINGFCLAALTESWKMFSHSPENVFNPEAKFKMVRNEDELLGRWKQGGGTYFTALGSFVWHYRGVSRGSKATRGKDGTGWFRRKE